MSLFIKMYTKELPLLNLISIRNQDHEIFLAMANLVCKHYVWIIEQLGEHKFIDSYCASLNEMFECNSLSSSKLFKTQSMIFSLN